MAKKIREKASSIIDDFLQSHRKGRELFGVWWTLFTVSMLSISVVFILFAILLAVFYL